MESLTRNASRFGCRLDSALDSVRLLWGFYQYRRLFPLSRTSEHRHLDCGILSRRPRLQGRRATAPHRVSVLELLWANNPHRHVLPRDFRFLLPESHALQLARALRLSSYRRERPHPRAQCAVATPWRIRFLARSFAEKAIQRPPDIASSRTQVGRIGSEAEQAPARGWPFPLQRRYGGAGDAIGMPWHKSRGIPRKQPRIGTPAKVSRSAQQENTRSRHSALRRPSPIPVTSVGRLGFCARIWSRACRRMCGYDSFGPFVPFDSASRSLRGRVSSIDPTR